MAPSIATPKGLPRLLRLSLVLLFTAWPGLALAQRTTATIYGLVEDSSGAPVPRADVKLVNVDTGAERAVTSGAQGELSVTFLSPGRYTLETEAGGFKLRREELRVGSGDQLRHVVRLEVGDVRETVTVAAATPVLQNASPTLTDRINRGQVEALPQARRDFTQLLGLQAGARPSSQGAVTFNGLAASGQTVTVDGVDGAGDVETPSLSMFNVVSQEAVQEVTVSKGVFSAEIARTFSGNINVITRSGTNQFHGSGFYNFQRDELNARNALLAPGSPKPEVKFDQFSGLMGGPIKRDRRKPKAES